MRKILAGLLILAFTVIAIALLVPVLIPAETLRNQAQTRASEVLNRQVSLSGDISLSILPKLEIRARNAAIANIDNFGPEPFVEMDEIQFILALGPLLSRRVEINEFVLIEPTIRLQQSGPRNNWTLGKPVNFEVASPNTQSSQFKRQAGALPFEASFGDVRIENGSISYSDGQHTRLIDALNLSVSLASVDAPIALEGGMQLDGHAMTFTARLGSLRGFFEGQSTPIKFALTGSLADIAFEGAFLESSDIALDGKADLTLPLRSLARYLGSNLPEGDVFRLFSAQSDLSLRPGQIRLSDANIVFDDIIADKGSLVLDYERSRPLIQGKLNVEQLDITPYLQAQDANTQAQAQTDSEFPPWSTAPIDFSPLRTLDADLSFTAQRFNALGIEADNVDITAKLDKGRLSADMAEFAFYGGKGQINAVVNARTAQPSYSLDAQMNGLDTLSFLKAATGFERLKGTGSINLDLNATGASQAGIMQSLYGTGDFDFRDGAIIGVNLAQVIRTVQQALETRSLPSGFTNEEQTDFSALTGSFTVQQGIATNTNLLMQSPLIRVMGTGSVNLPDQTLDYRLTPRAVADLTGQGGDADLTGLDVPIQLVGPFNAVKIRIDYAAIAQSLLRLKAGDLIDGNIGQVLSGGQSLEDTARQAAGNALLKALGGNSDDDTDPTRQVLQGLFGGNRKKKDDKKKDQE